MKLTFRQGIVRHATVGVNQAFLAVNGSTVDLITANGPTLITFAHGDSDYLFEEEVDVTSAWTGPFSAGTDFWLFWDIDRITGQRTFGHTTLAPLISVTKPSSPAEGQHWFDTANTKMFVFTNGIFVEVIRVFAAQYNGINVFTSQGIGIPNFTFAGTQVGISNILSFSGNIVFDNIGNTIRRSNGEFFTSESQFFISGSRINSVRLETTVNISKVDEVIPAYHVVKYTGPDRVALAEYEDTGSTVLGISTADINLGETGQIVLDGIVSNLDWDWQNIGVNLWVNTAGELTENDPNLVSNILHPTSRVPVARVLSSDRIIFQQGMGGKGEKGPPGTIETFPVATEFILGVSKLSVPSSTPTSPVVVGDNDPRMTDARNPLPHTHQASEVSFIPFGEITSSDVQFGMQDLEDNKLAISGGTMTGDLILNDDPTTSLQAASKRYVDMFVNGLVWLEPVFVINIISDNVSTPPLSPNFGDSYIMPSGTLTGAWSGFAEGDIIQWDNSSWSVLSNLSSFTSPVRFGIAFQTTATPSGTFTGRKNEIATFDPGPMTYTFETPVQNNAVYVNNASSVHSFHQFAFDGTKWVEFAGPHVVTFPITDLTDVLSTMSPNDNDVLTFDTASGLWEAQPSAPGGLQNVVEDLTPQLGGDLDVNGFNIISIDDTTGQPIVIQAGDSTDFIETGGAISIISGQNVGFFGTGGPINITAGAGDASGGNITVTGGTGASAGGDITITGGNATDLGNGAVPGGAISIISGEGKPSGDINITVPPPAGGTGGPGNLTLEVDEGRIKFLVTGGKGFEILSSGEMFSLTANYETLLDPPDDNAIPNKKYVDDEIAAVTVAYDIGFYNPTTITTDEILLEFTASTAFTMTQTNSAANSITAGTDTNTIINILKNAVNIGNITFTTGTNPGTVTITASTESFIIGDVLRLVADSTTVSTDIAQISVTLAGTAD